MAFAQAHISVTYLVTLVPLFQIKYLEMLI